MDDFNTIIVKKVVFLYKKIPFITNCDSSSAGRALASQAEGRGFEPRLSLFYHSTENSLHRR